MDSKCEALCEAMAKRIVARDFDAAHELLAPWLRLTTTAADIEHMVDEAVEGLPAPRAWRLDEGLLGVDDLQPDDYGPPSQPVSREITAHNYKGWFCIQFTPGTPDTDDGAPNVCFDLWLAAVEHEGVYRVGYLEAYEAT